ncbi:hypothetical protein Tco_0474705 [Tanacetum coccineum]
MSIHSSSHLRGQLGDHPRKHRNGADIENMTMSEYLEYEAAKERIVWDDVQSRRSPTHYDEGILALFTGIRDSICKQDVDLEKDREEDGDDGDIFYMWDITVEDVERVKQFLTPNVPDVMDNIIQPLIPKTIHTTPPDEDYVAPATKSILEYLFEEFRDEISNVTMVDEGAECSPTKDLEELERLLAKDPQSHYTKIRVHSVIIDPKPFIHTQLMSLLYGMFKTSKPCKGYNSEETKLKVTSTRNYVLLQVDAHGVVLGSFFSTGRHFKFGLVRYQAKDDDGIFVIMDVARRRRLGAWLRACCLFILPRKSRGVFRSNYNLVLEFSLYNRDIVQTKWEEGSRIIT